MQSDDRERSDPRPVAIVGVPYDGSSSFLAGAAGAPPLIREALWSEASNTWTEGGVDLAAPGVLTDAGNLELRDAATAREDIERGLAKILDRGRRPLSLGGDHSVTYPILRAMRVRYPGLSIVQFDAHPDLYDEFKGDRFSHACPFARIMEERLADRLIQIGIRTMNAHQRAQAERFGVQVIEMRAFDERLRLDVDGPIYVSLDMDALDPAFAPGVSHREPGGLSVRQLLRLIHSVRAPIIGADVVEYNPQNDPDRTTAVVCAKLVKELAGKMAASA